MLEYIDIPLFITERGFSLKRFSLSYELAGASLGSAPIVLVCHALTGNSSVAGPNGWWGALIGSGQTIDTERYTILAFNIPGNAYDGVECPEALDLTVRDVSGLILCALRLLNIDAIDTVIGASMGGALALNISYLAPALARQTIVVASDYRASDWLLAQTLVQKTLLEQGEGAIAAARRHAMLCYRTPESIDARFSGRYAEDKGRYEVEDWLYYHGEKLQSRFSATAYRVMTNLTATIHVCDTPEELASIEGAVRFVAVDTDLLFPLHRANQLYNQLRKVKPNTSLDLIHSIHGHDAFLMEYAQLNQIVAKYL